MKMTRNLAVIMFVLTFALTSTYIVKAAAAGGWDRQTAQDANGKLSGDNSNVKIVPVVSWSEPGVPISPSGRAATRLDRDFAEDHLDDVNQFGDDWAYDSANGRTNREADYQAHHWTPETYGLMGDYGRYSDK
jgi:hypothetical protein